MTLAAPLFLLLGAAAAAAVGAIHFIARTRPSERDLPTARFVPPSTLRAPAFQRRPSDLPLLALRALALLLLGLGLAGPAPSPARRPLARVVLLDNSRAVADPAQARARADAALAPGDVLVAFDSTARIVRPGEPAPVPAQARGALSAALVVAVREAARLARAADSLELVVVSPVVAEQWDAALPPLRALWPGTVRLERVAAASPAAPPTVAVAAAPDDPFRASAALLGAGTGAAAHRIARTAPVAADSAVAVAGAMLVDWPRDPAARFGARAATDTVGAIIAEGAVTVAPFPRAASLPAESGAVAVAWWVDGEPAATERPLGAGCVRRVAVPVAAIGDLAIRPSMLRFAAAMTAPCGGTRRFAPVPDTLVAAFAAPAATGATVRPAQAGSRPLAAALLVLAVLVLAAEQVLRRRPS